MSSQQVWACKRYKKARKIEVFDQETNRDMFGANRVTKTRLGKWLIRH